MAVTVLFGKGGSGKTALCYSQIREWEEQGGKALLIVPDQATYGAERRFAETMPGKGFMGTQIVGFSRLAYRVFQEQGKEHDSLSELARKIILQRLLRNHEEEFTVLQTAARQPHFAATAGRFIWECRSFRIGPSELRRAAAALENGTLARKLRDIALLYEGYTAFLQTHFGSADDMMTLLAQEIPNYTFLQGARIWVDGFQWFTPQQLAVLQSAEKAAAHMTVTLTMDADNISSQARETALFHRPYEVYRDLRHVFPHLETAVADAMPGSGIREFAGDFFRVVPAVRQTPVPGLAVLECSNREVEIDAIARQIRRLSRQGYRYRDFLILVRASDMYQHVAERVLAAYEIPCFSDYRRPMTAHPVAEAIAALLEVFQSRWAYEPLFRLLKTDLFPLSRQDVDELENYCLAYGIQGSHWINGRAWQYGKNDCENKNDWLSHINGIRQAVSDILMPLWETAQKPHTLREWCTLLYQWLAAMKVPETLSGWQQEDEAAGRAMEAKEHEQVWKRVVLFLDEIVRLCGDDVTTLDEFSQIIEDGMGDLKFSLIPPTLDHVTLTSVERGYTMQAAVVFLCGVNDGIFPQYNGEDSILNDTERQRLGGLGLKLGPGSRFRSFQEKFLFYLAATRAADRLYISYVLADEDGGAMEPSSWIRQIIERGYVTALIRETGDLAGGSEAAGIVALPAALTYLPVMLRPALEGRPVADVWWALYDWACGHGWKEQAVRAVLGLFYRNVPQRLPSAAVRKLYMPDGRLRGSVTKFEQYRTCPFAYFSRYGLLLEERPVYRFAAPDLGMLVHGALRILGDELLEKKQQWHDIPADCISVMCRAATEQLAPQVQHDILMSNAYFVQIKERLIQTLTRTVRRLCEFSAASDFHMEGLEKSFGRQDSPWEALHFLLSDGTEVIVTGQIDRVDALRLGDKKYVVIIDYKSGRKQLDLSQVFTGLELQLLTYMFVALLNMGSDAVPAAVLYCYVRNDKISLNHMATEEEKRDLYNKNSRLSGFYLEDSEVMQALDTSLQGYSAFLNLHLKKDGSLSNMSRNIYNEEGWQHLLSLASRRIYQIAGQIRQGDISIHPVLMGQNSPCRYCPYHAVCRFDVQIKDNTYAVVAKTAKDDIIKEIYKEGDTEYGMD